MKISIVIPVYNEAERLADCLRAIAAQTTRPYEVIVVDNNSTDATAKIAAGFAFVRLLKEPRQGVVHARNHGFNAARGDVIGRIDADTILPAAWLAKIAAIFKDDRISAVSGSPHYYDFALDKLADKIDRRLRGRLAQKLAAENFLWGANMAVRRSAWQRVRRDLCCQAGLHEDFDLAIHLQALNLKVAYDASLVANVSSRRIDTGLTDYIKYTLVSPNTYAHHQLKSRRHMYSVLLVCWLCYLPGRLIYRLYNQSSAGMALRVDPSSNVA